MADVLQLLRNALSAKQAVAIDGAKENLVFPDGAKHGIATPSSYRQSRGVGEPYAIGAIWFYCTNSKLALGQYRTQGRAYGLINRIDQKDLLDYVTGETESSVAVKEVHSTIFDAVEPSSKRPRLDGHAAASAADGETDAAAAAAQAVVEEADFLPKCVGVEDVLAREKVLTTRNSILLAPDPKHFSAVEGLYAQTIRRTKEAKKKPKGPSPKAKSNREVEREVDRMRLTAKDGYYANRTEQNADANMRSRVGGDVDINFGGTAASWMSEGSKSTKKDGAPEAEAAVGAGGAGAGAGAGAVDDGPAPIIIVPTDGRGALTIFNIKDLLEKGRYKTTAEAKAAGARRERRVTLHRTMKGGVLQRYEVVDNARSVRKNDEFCI